MLGYMFARVADVQGFDWEIRTAGTHAVEGQAMSARTSAALVGIDDLGVHPYRSHRSHQLTDDDVTWADVIITVEAAHVNFVRHQHPIARGSTLQLGQFLLIEDDTLGFSERVHRVTQLEPSPALDVADPAGHDQDVYDRCARDLWVAAQRFGALFDGSGTPG
jgi:protein-tyrosine-phosphatase